MTKMAPVPPLSTNPPLKEKYIFKVPYTPHPTICLQTEHVREDAGGSYIYMSVYIFMHKYIHIYTLCIYIMFVRKNEYRILSLWYPLLNKDS